MGKTAQARTSSEMAPILATEGANRQAFLDMMAHAPPRVAPLQLNDIDKLVNTQAILSAYKNRAAEQELNPEEAQARQQLGRDIATQYQDAQAGRYPPAVQRALVQAGLEKGLSTGLGTAPGTAGNLGAARLLASGDMAYLNNVRNMLANYLQANPQPEAALDPATAAQMVLGNTREGVNAENAFQQQLLGATGSAEANRQNLGMSLLESGAQEDAFNRAQKGKKGGQLLGTLGSLGGGVVGSMYGGPIGGMLGSQLGGAIGGSVGSSF